MSVNTDLSVVVPVYNDPERVRHTHKSVTDQTSSAKEYEVLMLNNDPTDSKLDVIISTIPRVSTCIMMASYTILRKELWKRDHRQQEGVRIGDRVW